MTRLARPDGTDLQTRHWAADPAAGPPWATVLIVHGLGEHSGRYEHVGDHLAELGIDTWSYDQRGFGASSGRRAYVDTWSQVHDDLAAMVASVRAAAAGRPVVLYGHSLGGLIAIGYVLTDRPKPDLLVLSAPALDSTQPRWKRVLAPVLARVAPTLKIPNGLEGDQLSRDPAVGERYFADPSNVFNSTTRFGAAVFREQARVAAGLGRLGLPTFVIQGEADTIVPAWATAVLEGRTSVTRRTYPAIRHELHNEPDGLRIVDDVVAWIRSAVPAVSRV